ncbi:MAG: nucleotidyltransferase domain-containing protein, partial [Nanoarchaeota archaeon]|nr:nucleotidyltransferase domain-containing protein [Nanoarchaeota archaeon]
LKKYRAQVVYLFGSAATGETTALSDVDIGIVFKDIRAKNKDPSGIFTELYEAFRHALNMPFEQRLDLVYLQEAPLRLQMNAIKYGKVLYQKSEDIRTDYEDYATMRYLDWKYADDLYLKEVAEEITGKRMELEA